MSEEYRVLRRNSAGGRYFSAFAAHCFFATCLGAHETSCRWRNGVFARHPQRQLVRRIARNKTRTPGTETCAENYAALAQACCKNRLCAHAANGSAWAGWIRWRSNHLRAVRRDGTLYVAGWWCGLQAGTQRATAISATSFLFTARRRLLFIPHLHTFYFATCHTLPATLLLYCPLCLPSHHLSARVSLLAAAAAVFHLAFYLTAFWRHACTTLKRGRMNSRFRSRYPPSSGSVTSITNAQHEHWQARRRRWMLASVRAMPRLLLTPYFAAPAALSGAYAQHNASPRGAACARCFAHCFRLYFIGRSSLPAVASLTVYPVSTSLQASASGAPS